MGRNEKYYKDLTRQATEKLISMQAFGESKRAAVEDGTASDKIFSFATYKTYKQQVTAFTQYVQATHQEVRSLKKARPFVREWLQKQVDDNKSAWTIQTQSKALGKLYGITPDSKDYFEPPVRHREDIKRSRGKTARDKHFSKTNNDELIRFCKGIGARREGMTKMTGKDLMTIEQINKHVERLETAQKTRKLSAKELTQLNICKDAQAFTGVTHFVYLKEKGGRERISPIVGPDKDMIVERFKNTAPDEKVWKHVPSNADIHGYRSDYSNTIYKMYARDIKDIPFDKINKGSGRPYQSEAYHCRVDEKGKVLDRRAMILSSKALGHNRIEVVANNYIRGL